MVEKLITISAKIELLLNKGSRKTPIYSGYRPLFNFTDVSTKVSGRIDLIDSDSLSPGKVGIVKITFIRGILNDNVLNSGEKFTFDEGQSLIGNGKIIEVLNDPC